MTEDMATTTSKPVHSLVLDAGPIIKNEPPVSTLIGQAETLYTVSSVIDELRDAETRSRVETTLLPFLTLRNPRPASVKVIADFARRTGDLEVLSRPDIQILALAYELECERNHGDWRLRSTPGQKRLNGAVPSSLTDGLPSPLVDNTVDVSKSEPQPIPETRGAWGTTIPPIVEAVESEIKPVETEAIAVELDTTVSEGVVSQRSEEAEETNDTNPSDHISEDAQETPGEAPVEQLSQLIIEEPVESIESESDTSDAEGWITPSNIKKHQEKDLNGAVEPQEEVKVMQVATITTDFAMQNVLLRMNLNLLSPSLQRIKHLKTWVLRCHACFDITKDMSKQFCSRCGKPTLLRTSCSTDKDGNFKVHLKKNMQWNTRGNVYSIPKPIAGTANTKIVSGGGQGGWGHGLILAEDQKEYVQAMANARRKKEKDLMDEDYLPNILSGDRRGPGGRPKVGAGKNVNSRKRH